MDSVGLTLKLDSLCITASKRSWKHLDALVCFQNILSCLPGKVCFGRDLPKCEGFVGSMAEMARNIVGGHQLVMKCTLIRLVSYAAKNCRSRETEGAWLLSHCRPQKLLWWY